MALCWEDPQGRPLPMDKDGRQILRLLGGRCGPLDVRIRVPGADRVELEAQPPEQLEQVVPGLFRRPARSRSVDAARAAGALRATAWAGDQLLARGSLQVLPANFDDAEYAAMLRDIGLMAITSATAVEAQLPASIVASITRSSADATVGGECVDQTRLAVTRCVDEVIRAFPVIARHPLRQLRRHSQPVPFRRVAHTRAGALAFARSPGRLTVMGKILVDDVDCAENQFLRWLIERRLMPMVDAFLASAWADEDATGETALDEWCSRYIRRNPALQTLEVRLGTRKRAVQKLREPSTWLGERRKQLVRLLGSRLLRDVALPIERPPITERLRGSPGYGAVYSAFTQLEPMLSGSLRKGLEVGLATINGQVKATWKCYELWCLTRIVRAFTVLGRFVTPSGQRCLAELLELKDGVVEIPRGSCIRLKRDAVDVEIYVEPEVRSTKDGNGQPVSRASQGLLRPDFLITMRTPRTGPLGKTVVLDAKYRDYGAQGCDVLFKDIWTTAYVKYLDGIGNHESGRFRVVSSFILHSDPESGSAMRDFWGGESVTQWLRDQGFAPPVLPVPEPPGGGHAVGLVRLRPDEHCERQLGRLLDMWLQYFEVVEPDDCPRCGRHLSTGEDIRQHQAGPGVEGKEIEVFLRCKERTFSKALVCVCPGCSHYWFLNSCRKCHRMLYKRGRQSFHSRSAHPENIGMYQCPSCFNDPSPDELRGVVR